MGNPFDELEKKSSRSHDPIPKHDAIHFSFKINKRWFERSVYILIIIVLSILLIVQPFDNVKSGDATSEASDSLDEAVQGEEDLSVNETTVEITAAAASEPEEEEAQEEPEEKEEESGSKSDYILSISSVDVVRDGDKPILMKSITLVEKNGYKNLNLRFEAHWYEDDSPEDEKDKVKGTKLVVSRKGTEQMITMDDFDYKGLNIGEDAEIIEVQAIDPSTGDVVRTAKKTIS